MPRPQYRAILEQGLRLDINWLIRHGLVRPGEWVGELKMRWQLDCMDKEAASGLLTSDMQGTKGYLRMQIGNIDQSVKLATQPRHFGGHQWYFICPVLEEQCSILWKPIGANRFAGSRAWKRQAAYSSQFQTPRDRAISAARQIRVQLGGAKWVALNGIDPLRPKGMRKRTYQRLLQKSHRYEQTALAFLPLPSA